MSTKKHNTMVDKPEVEEVNETVETVEVEETPAKKEPEAKTGKVVGCDKLRVRESASENAKILCLVTPADVLTVRGKKDSWLRVITPDGTAGFVMAKYVEISK